MASVSYTHLHGPRAARPSSLLPTVTVLIPTLDRYPHLFVLLDHLRAQSVPPLEIIVVDQTAAEERDTTWPARFADLPLRVIQRDTAGQCSSRNAVPVSYTHLDVYKRQICGRIFRTTWPLPAVRGS